MKTPRHPKALKYLHRFRENEFSEVSQRIGELEEEHERGAAWEVWVLGYVATQLSNDIELGTLWLGRPNLEVINRLKLDPKGKDFGIDGGWINRQFGTDDVFNAKFKRDRGKLNYSADDLAHLFTSAHSPHISGKYIISNSYEVDDYTKSLPGYAAILGDELNKLSAQELHQIVVWLEGEEVIVEPKPPRVDQLKAVAKINQYLQVDDRTKCIMACGTGKTLVGLLLDESRLPSTTLVLVPSLNLLRQTLKEWRSLQNPHSPKFVPLCVCSDPSVDPQNDQIVFAREDCPFKVTTSPEEVRRFLDRPTNGRKVVFCTYQSSRVIKETLRPEESFDLAIFDEAHHTAGWDDDARDKSLALDNRHIKIKKRVFFTATPRHCTTRERDEDGQPKPVYSMEDEADYGREEYLLSFKEAVDLDIILPFKVLVSVITSAELEREEIKNGIVHIEGEGDGVWANEVANQIALAEAAKEFGIRKLFSFHRKISHAKDFVAGIGRFLEGYVAEHVSSEMSAHQREQRLDLIARNPKAILSNAGCLREGVNVPSLDAVAFFTATKSQVSIAQAMGRVMRKDPKNPDKKLGYVLLPLYVEMANDEDPLDAARRTNFDVVLEVLQTVLEVDEALREKLVELVVKKDVAGARDLLRPLVEIRAAHPHPSVEMERLLEAIANRCIDGIIAPFEVRWRQIYDQLVAYKEREGNCNVPYYYGAPEDEHGKYVSPLHAWSVVQRKRYKEGTLAQHRVKLLNDIGFCWDLDQAIWDQFIKELRDHYAAHGHWQFGTDRLGRKTRQVRQEIKEGKVPQARIDELIAEEFPLDGRALIDERWMKTVGELRELFLKNGHRKIPTKFRSFAQQQRSRRQKGILASEREAILNELPFPWDPHEEIWEEMFARFCEVQRTGSEPDKRLKSWISNQRSDFANDRLAKDRAKRLEEEGMCWNERDGDWQKRFEEYCQYVRETGDRYGHKAPKPHRSWMASQRLAYRAKKLQEARINLLEAAGFLWEHPTTSCPHTHCKRGHEFTEESTGWDKRGTRRCLKCDALRARLKRGKDMRKDDNEKAAPL